MFDLNGTGMMVASFKNPTQILQILDRSNCRQCNEPTCLAFAAGVFRGERKLNECPKLDRDVIDGFDNHEGNPPQMEDTLQKKVAALQSQITTLDFATLAYRTGATVSGHKITIKVLGKAFSVDSEGNLYSDIHVHPWITIPILSYLIDCRGTLPAGNWVPFRELGGGKTWFRLFEQRCEKPLKKVADQHTELFEDMIHVFNGKQLGNLHTSDISLVLYPLPKVPIRIRYSEPEDGLDSEFNIFFDSTAEENLNIESIYVLGTGLVRMFEKISFRHGSD